MTEKASPRTAVVTGCTSGIGFEVVRGLAEAGWRVIGIARSPIRGRRMTEILRAQTGNPAITFHAADLSLTTETEAVGDLIARQHPRLDLLINNAGAIFRRRRETTEAVERTLALNHLAYVVLTAALLPALERAGAARIVNVASAAHHGATLELDDLGCEQGRYSGWSQYQRSKLMNILFTRELARHLPGGVTTTALHPGFVRTRFGHENGPSWRLMMQLMMRLSAIRPEAAAQEVLRLALAPELAGVSGAYFSHGQSVRPSPEAENDELAARLWQATRHLLETIAAAQQKP